MEDDLELAFNGVKWLEVWNFARCNIVDAVQLQKVTDTGFDENETSWRENSSEPDVFWDLVSTRNLRFGDGTGTPETWKKNNISKT